MRLENGLGKREGKQTLVLTENLDSCQWRVPPVIFDSKDLYQRKERETGEVGDALREWGERRQTCIDSCEHPRISLGLASHHDAVDPLKVTPHLWEGGDAPVDGEGEVREVGDKLVHLGVVEGRDVAVLFWGETVQPGLSGVHNDVADRAPAGDLVDEVG